MFLPILSVVLLNSGTLFSLCEYIRFYNARCLIQNSEILHTLLSKNNYSHFKFPWISPIEANRMWIEELYPKNTFSHSANQLHFSFFPHIVFYRVWGKEVHKCYWWNYNKRYNIYAFGGQFIIKDTFHFRDFTDNIV